MSARAVKAAELAFIEAKRRALTDEAGGSGAGFGQEGQPAKFSNEAREARKTSPGNEATGRLLDSRSSPRSRFPRLRVFLRRSSSSDWLCWWKEVRCAVFRARSETRLGFCRARRSSLAADSHPTRPMFRGKVQMGIHVCGVGEPTEMGFG